MKSMRGPWLGAGTHNPGRLGSIPSRATIEPAAAIWLGLVAAALGWDVALIRSGHRSLSEVAGGTTAGRLLVLYLAAHLLHVGPRRLDPLARVADLIRRLP